MSKVFDNFRLNVTAEGKNTLQQVLCILQNHCRHKTIESYDIDSSGNICFFSGKVFDEKINKRNLPYPIKLNDAHEFVFNFVEYVRNAYGYKRESKDEGFFDGTIKDEAWEINTEFEEQTFNPYLIFTIRPAYAFYGK